MHRKNNLLIVALSATITYIYITHNAN